MTNSQFVVAWADTQTSSGSQTGCGPISSLPPWRSARNVTEETNAHHHWNVMAEQHVHWQEQGRQAWNFQQAGFERAAQGYVQAARDEVHVAVAQATEMSRAEMREVRRAPKKQVEKTWKSHQGTLLNEMNIVASDALENPRRSLLNEATTELQRHHRQKKSRASARNSSKQSGATCQKFNKKSKSNRLRVEKKLTIGDRKCLSLLLKDRIVRIC